MGHLLQGIYCLESRIISLGLMEKELYQLYTALAEKIQDLAARSLFTYIATDSLKHTKILASIIEEAGGSKFRERDCNDNISYNIDLIKALIKDISKRSLIFREKLNSLISTFMDFEICLFDEYSKAFHIEKRFIKNDKNEKFETDLDIFSLIVDDEARHRRILSYLADNSEKELEFKSNTPKFRYQRPDAWSIPPR